MPQTETRPTDEERAKFYLENSIGLVGYTDTLAGVVGECGVPRPAGVESAEEAIENLSLSFHEGARREMMNKREHGFSPVKAWDIAVHDSWPSWVKVSLAESEYSTFGGRARDPDFVSEEEEEYLSFLEKEFEVPR